MHRDAMHKVKTRKNSAPGSSELPENQTGVEDEPRKRLHAHIPASLHTKLKLKAVTDDRDMTELVIEALTEYLDA